MTKKKQRPPAKKNLNERPERYSGNRNRRHKYKKEPRKPLIAPSIIPGAIIILAYIFIVTFTPNWMALDTNATKFMTLSMLNLVAFIYLLSDRGIRQEPGILLKFFTTNVGIVYTGFLVMNLVSFIPAINIVESVLHFSKVFSVFTATLILSVLLMRELRYVKMILFVMTLLLIFDSLSVFYYIGEFINGEVDRISDIKTVYSNKNILASSIYVKLPFALSMLMFDKGKLKYLGWVALFFGMLATFFMATRTFYLGLILLSLAFLAYTLIHFLRRKERKYVSQAGAYMAALVLSLVVFSYIQQYHYPGMREARLEQRRSERAEAREGEEDESRPRASGGRHTQPVMEQLATISWETGSRNRTNAWIWSLEIIKENPLLGVGTGNWKVNILEYENQQNTGFIYLYKAHNDFLETMAETGIIGGLLFISIFVLMGWNFIKQYRKRADDPGVLYRALFLAAAGLAFYSVDAFFNFPADRPEILLLWALYLSMGIAATIIQKEEAAAEQADSPASEEQTAAKAMAPSFGHPLLPKVSALLAVALMGAVIYILTVNFQSSKLQRIIYQDIMAGELRHESDMFMGEFPFIPNVSIWGESISSLKARYLMEEEQYRKTIDVLEDDRSNPWDGRREFFMATAYNNLGKKDSAMVYSRKAYEIKPHYFRNVHLLTSLLQEKDREDEVGPILDGYLAHDKSNAQAYLYATSFFNRQGELDHAWNHIDTAYQVMPGNDRIQQQHEFLEHQKFVAPHQDLYRQAAEYYNNNRYEEALPYLDEFIEKTPFDANVYRMRAFSNYHLGNHEAVIEDVDVVLEEGEEVPSLVNLRGVCYRALGDEEAACADFRTAMEAGNESGETNFNNFCREEEQ
ncbi:MAG: O-antigen ligase family protein [Bacteroidales bacterium]